MQAKFGPPRCNGSLGAVILVGVVGFVAGATVASRHGGEKAAPSMEEATYGDLRNLLEDKFIENSRLYRQLMAARADARRRPVAADAKTEVVVRRVYVPVPTSASASRDGHRPGPTLASIQSRPRPAEALEVPVPEDPAAASTYVAIQRGPAILASEPDSGSNSPMIYPWEFDGRFSVSGSNLSDAMVRMRRLVHLSRIVEVGWRAGKLKPEDFDRSLGESEQGIRDVEQAIRDSEQTMRDFDQSIMDSKNWDQGWDIRALEAKQRDREARQRDYDARERARQAECFFASLRVGRNAGSGDVANRLSAIVEIMQRSGEQMEQTLAGSRAFSRSWRTSDQAPGSFEASVRSSESCTKQCEASTGIAEKQLAELEASLGSLIVDSEERIRDAENRDVDAQIRVADAERRIEDTRKPVPYQYRLGV